MITQKAFVSHVNIGNISIEGLMYADGSFGVALPQVTSLYPNSVPKNRSLKQLEALLGITLSSHQKVKTTLNSKVVNAISLDDFEKLTLELAMKGDKDAQSLVRILYGLALTQIFSDTFNIKFEKEERQEFIKARQIHKEVFPSFTKWLQADGCFESWEYGKAVNEFKTLLGLPLITVDLYTAEQQWVLNKGELKYDTLRTVGISHEEVLKQF